PDGRARGVSLESEQRLPCGLPPRAASCGTSVERQGAVCRGGQCRRVRERLCGHDERAPRCVLHTGDPFHQLHIGWIIDFMARNRLPAIYQLRENVLAGGLMSYGASQPDLFRRAAAYVSRILRGTKPGALPVEQPTKFELAMNLKAAKAIGLTIPDSFLLRA